MYILYTHREKGKDWVSEIEIEIMCWILRMAPAIEIRFRESSMIFFCRLFFFSNSIVPDDNAQPIDKIDLILFIHSPICSPSSAYSCQYFFFCRLFVAYDICIFIRMELCTPKLPECGCAVDMLDCESKRIELFLTAVVKLQALL